MDIFREFTFEAASQITDLPEWNACGRVHGHSYRVEVWLRGEVPEGRPWFKDWGELEEPILKVKELIDHRFLNEVPGIGVPSCERLAIWMWKALVAFGVDGSLLHALKIYEGERRMGVVYHGPDRPDSEWG